MIIKDGEEMRNIGTTYYKRLHIEDSMATREDRREDIILQSIPRKGMKKMITQNQWSHFFMSLWILLKNTSSRHMRRSSPL